MRSFSEEVDYGRDNSYITYRSNIYSDGLGGYQWQTLQEKEKGTMNKDENVNELLYEVLNAALESGKRMGYAQGREETAREILQELKKQGIIYHHFERDDHLAITMDRLKALAQKYGIELE